MTRIAITRELNTGLGDCELTYQSRVAIDIPLAQQQHAYYQSALSSLGCEIVVVPTQPGLADSVFIEDTALVLDEIAVMLRPGAASRQPEVEGVKSVLQQYRMLRAIEPPGTLDGGDLLCIGNTIFAGVSTRSNREGIRQLENIVRKYCEEVGIFCRIRGDDPMPSSQIGCYGSRARDLIDQPTMDKQQDFQKLRTHRCRPGRVAWRERAADRARRNIFGIVSANYGKTAKTRYQCNDRRCLRGAKSGRRGYVL
jgi:hypothetical protein